MASQRLPLLCFITGPTFSIPIWSRVAKFMLAIVVMLHMGNITEAVKENCVFGHNQYSPLLYTFLPDLFDKMQCAIPEDFLIVRAPNEILTNVPYPMRGYRFSLTFRNICGEKVLWKDEQPLYACKVEPAYVGIARPWRERETGNSFCLFFPSMPVHLDHHTTLVSVNVLSVDGVVLGHASAPFIGGFSILSMDKDFERVVLTRESNKIILSIVGNRDVEVQWKKKDFVSITRIPSGENGSGSLIKFEVKLLKDEEFYDRIIISVPVIGQRMEFYVCHRDETGVYNGLMMYGAGILFVTFVFLLWELGFEHPQVTKSATPGTCLVGSEKG